jgi:cytochrome P450
MAHNWTTNAFWPLPQYCILVFACYRYVDAILESERVFKPQQTLFRAVTSPLRHIPGPFWSRFTRLPLKKAIIGGRRIFFIDELHERYGDVVRIAPDEISVADTDGFKQIHAVSSKFVKDHWYEELTIFPRHSVFTMQTKETHAARRKLFAKGFSKTYLREHYEPIVAEKAKLAVDGLKKRALAGSADLMQWWTFLATDTVGQLGFGESFGMLEKGEVSILEIT